MTLTGAGGVGKTRLALEVARRLLPGFADGAVLAELGPLTDSQLVAAAVAGTLTVTPVSGGVSVESVVGGAGRPASPRGAGQL